MTVLFFTHTHMMLGKLQQLTMDKLLHSKPYFETKISAKRWGIHSGINSSLDSHFGLIEIVEIEKAAAFLQTLQASKIDENRLIWNLRVQLVGSKCCSIVEVFQDWHANNPGRVLLDTHLLRNLLQMQAINVQPELGKHIPQKGWWWWRWWLN